MDPLIVLGLIFIAITFTAITFLSKFKIFGFLTAGVYIALIIELQTNLAISMVLAVGVILMIVYATGLMK